MTVIIDCAAISCETSSSFYFESFDNESEEIDESKSNKVVENDWRKRVSERISERRN